MRGRSRARSTRWPSVVALTLGLVSCTQETESSTTTSRVADSPTSTTAPSLGAELAVLEDVTAPSWEPVTRTDEILVEMAESGEVTSQLAIDALALIAEDVPGASASDLPPGPGLSHSYTRHLLDRVRDDLTPDQIAFADVFFDPGPTVGTVDPDGTISPTEGVGDQALLLRTEDGGDIRGIRAAVPPPGAEEMGYLVLLSQVHEKLAGHVPGMPPFQVELHLSDKPPDRMEAWIEGDGTCHVEVLGGFRKRNAPENEVEFFFAHEIFHCVQQHWEGNGLPPAWLVEGSADFVAYDVSRDDQPGYDGGFHEWFTQAQIPLHARQYDAWPLFENFRDGHDVYGAIHTMLAAPLSTTGDLLTIGGLDGVVFRRDWSTRTLRASGFDETWEFRWPAITSEFGPVDNVHQAMTRGLGTYDVEGRPLHAQPQITVAMTPEVGLVTASPSGGALTTWTALGTQTVQDGRSGKFCFAADDCRCPAGTTSSAIPMNNRVMVFSFPADLEGVEASVVAEPWDPGKECRLDPENDQAETNGDPHLLTFDGLPYDVITLGEFVSTRDPAGDFEVQTRHEPFRHGAGTTAVAIGTGSSRITFTTADFVGSETVIRVDGVATTESSFAVDGVEVKIGTSEFGGSEIVATWPDGSQVELRWFMGWFVQVSVPPDRAARMEGLLGSKDGDFGNDLVLPDGRVVDTLDAQTDESPFVLSWAVDELTTLFDYGPGESVATFRIPHPNPTPPAIDDTVVELCTEALGPAAATHELTSCAYDVTVTGNVVFVAAYEDIVERRVEDDGFVRPELTTPTPPSGPTGDVVAGEPVLVLSTESPVGHLEGTAGSALVGLAESCPEGLFVDIVVRVAADPSTLARAALCDPSEVGAIGVDADEWHQGEAYVWLSDDETYEVVLDVVLGDSEQFGELTLYADPTPTILQAADLVDGDTRTLVGIADTVVYLPDPSKVLSLTGFDLVCGVEIYRRLGFPNADPWTMSVCRHPEEYDQPPTDTVVPLVVFNRGAEPVEIVLRPVD